MSEAIAIAGLVAATMLAGVPAPPNAHVLNLRRADFPADWSVAKGGSQELQGCRRIPFLRRAYSPRFFKATSTRTTAIASRVTVYATVALARREIRLIRDATQRACVNRAFVAAARKAYGSRTRVTIFTPTAPRQAALALGYLVTYPSRGLIVKAYYEDVLVTHARVVTQLGVIGVFRRADASLVQRLTDVLARRALGSPS